jgi:ribonuclease P protein component
MSRRVLRSRWQFRLVYERGKKINCRHAVVFYLHGETGEPPPGPLFGVVASKRVGGAVHRNRAKRLLRHAVQTTADRLTRRDVWVVLVAKRSILDCTSREVARDLEQGMMGEGMIRGEAPE